MGCKQLQLNNFFQFVESEEINRRNFRFVESKEQAPYASVPRNRTFKIFPPEDFIGDDVLSQLVTAKPSEAGTTPNSPLSTSYLLYDGHGSTRLLTSDTGTITARYNYDAYGKNLFSANVATPSATDLLYSGEQFDPNLQMQYLRARYYDQNNGRFNRLDPFSGNNYDPQSLHKYAYCHGNPVMGIDPSGEMTLIEVLSVAFIVSVLANLAFATLISDVSKRSGPEFWVGFYSSISLGGIGIRVNGALMTLMGLNSGKFLSFKVYWVDFSLITAGALVLGTGAFLTTLILGVLESLALSSTTLPAISDFLIGIMEKSSESIIPNDLAQAGASFGAGLTLAWAKEAGDLAGLSFGAEGGAGAAPALAFGGGYTRGINVGERKLNGAWAVSAGFAIGKTGGINPSGVDAGGLIAFAVPNNMPDWSLSDL